MYHGYLIKDHFGLRTTKNDTQHFTDLVSRISRIKRWKSLGKYETQGLTVRHSSNFEFQRKPRRVILINLDELRKYQLEKDSQF